MRTTSPARAQSNFSSLCYVRANIGCLSNDAYKYLILFALSCTHIEYLRAYYHSTLLSRLALLSHYRNVFSLYFLTLLSISWYGCKGNEAVDKKLLYTARMTHLRHIYQNKRKDASIVSLKMKRISWTVETWSVANRNSLLSSSLPSLSVSARFSFSLTGRISD